MITVSVVTMWLYGGLKTYWQEKAAKCSFLLPVGFKSTVQPYTVVTIETVIISTVQSQHSFILVHGVLYTLLQLLSVLEDSTSDERLFSVAVLAMPAH